MAGVRSRSTVRGRRKAAFVTHVIEPLREPRYSDAFARIRIAFRRDHPRKHFMPQNYVPMFIFAFLAFLVAAGTLALFYLVRPRNPFKTKLMPYECGITPFDSARGRYTIRFYIVAILFVVFDVETIFLFPWAVQFKLLGLFGLLEMLIFLGILIVGYIWIWKKGALEWV
jgi:NADH-quinone oxidoreductase subunit A